MSNTRLPLAAIRSDGGTQPRAALSPEVVAQYRDEMVAGIVFPAVVVFHDGRDYWLADGFHRLNAASLAGAPDIEADVRQGTQRDAVLYSVGANAAHGLRRTNADKRRAVDRLLRDSEWARWSDREIGRRCGVDGKTVAAARADLSAEVPQTGGRLVERGGAVFEMDTEGIGPTEDARAEEMAGFLRRPPEWAALPSEEELLTHGWATLGRRGSDVWPAGEAFPLEAGAREDWAYTWPSKRHPGHVYVSVIKTADRGEGGGFEERTKRPVRVDGVWRYLDFLHVRCAASWFPYRSSGPYGSPEDEDGYTPFETAERFSWHRAHLLLRQVISELDEDLITNQ